MSVTPNITVVNTKGEKVISKSKAMLYWGEGQVPMVKAWTPSVHLPQLEELVSAFKECDIAIAGGAVLGAYDAVEYGDIDVFPLSEAMVAIGTDILCKLGYSITSTKEHFIMFKKEDSCCRPVQLITVHTDISGDVQRLLNRFDLSVCQVAVYKRRLHSNSIAIRDIKLKYLRVTGTANIGSLLTRLTKYGSRGYVSQTVKES